MEPRNKVGKALKLDVMNQACVDSLVSKSLSADETISLRGLRMALQECGGINLESRKAEIKCRAIQALENLTMGVSITKLSHDHLTRIPDPYKGVWEPCGHSAVERTAMGESRGRDLFVSLTDWCEGSHACALTDCEHIVSQLGNIVESKVEDTAMSCACHNLLEQFLHHHNSGFGSDLFSLQSKGMSNRGMVNGKTIEPKLSSQPMLDVEVCCGFW